MSGSPRQLKSAEGEREERGKSSLAVGVTSVGFDTFCCLMIPETNGRVEGGGDEEFGVGGEVDVGPGGAES